MYTLSARKKIIFNQNLAVNKKNGVPDGKI